MYFYHVIGGLTGTRKTKTLECLETKYSEQVLNLEELACHRGSVLGGFPLKEQPSQRLFESKIIDKLSSFVSTRPVWVEGESQTVGNLIVPKNLWKSAIDTNAKQIYDLQSSLEDRVDFLYDEYQSWRTEKQKLKEVRTSYKIPLRVRYLENQFQMQKTPNPL